MDFMNLNQSAHGDREAGFLHTRMRLGRKVFTFTTSARLQIVAAHRLTGATCECGEKLVLTFREMHDLAALIKATAFQLEGEGAEFYRARSRRSRCRRHRLAAARRTGAP